jgi:hypothetical protein
MARSSEEEEEDEGVCDKSLTGEPILPARTANLARYWFVVRAGKIGSPVRDLSGGGGEEKRFIYVQ